MARIKGNVNNYAVAENVRNCYLVGLTDLYGALDYVRNAVAGYLNNLVDLGVAGIRIDAAKHMWPAVCLNCSVLEAFQDQYVYFSQDIANMLSRVKDLPTSHGFPSGSKLFVYNEVIDRDDGAVRVDEYYDTGKIFSIAFVFITI